MKNPSLDNLYNLKLDKHIKLVEGYTELTGLSSVLRMCRMKPYSYFFEEKKDKLILHRHWFDEFGNSFKLVRKQPYIEYNDTSLNKDKIICTDLYNGLSINKICKISKLVYLIAGKDEDLYQDCYLLTCLGLDNYLRSYMYLYDEWKQIAPLYLGLDNLLLVAEHSGIQYFKEIKNLKNAVIPCVGSSAWLSCLPIGPTFQEFLKREHPIVESLL